MLRSVLALLVLAVNGCTCAGAPAAKTCVSSADCAADELCLAGADGSPRCVPRGPDLGEGEGAAGEGEGAGGEGEGAAGEGEGAGGEGEGVGGEGEGEGSCGDGVTTSPEQCDDGNANDKDLCTSACAPTSVTVTTVLGGVPLASLPLQQPDAVWASASRGAVVSEATGAIWFAPPSGDFFRVDASAPAARAPGYEPVTVPAAVAIAPDGRVVYYDHAGNVVRSLDPATGDDVVVVGNGATSPIVDPPSFVFAGGALTVPFSEAQPVSIDVDSDGTIYVATDRRVIAAGSDGSAHVVAGTVQSATTGTPAQRHTFTFLRDVSVEEDAGGNAVALWVADTDDPSRVNLVDGTINTMHGEGFQCDGGQLQNCQLNPDLVVVDGAGGAFWVISDGSVLHVAGPGLTDIVTTVAAASTTAFGQMLDVAVVAPGTLAIAKAGPAESLRLVTIADGTESFVAAPAPAHGTDQTLFSITAASASASNVYFASGADLYRVDESGALIHVASVNDLTGCDAPGGSVPVVGALGATNDDSILYVALTGTSEVCALDLVGGTSSQLVSDVPSPAAMAVRTGDVLVASDNGVISVKRDGVSAQSTVLASIVRDVASDGTIAHLTDATGRRTFVAAAPLNTLSFSGTPTPVLSDVRAVAVTGSSTSVVYAGATHVLAALDIASNASTIAGNAAASGFSQGPTLGARFDDGVRRIARLADGAVAVISDDAIQLVKSGAVTTLVGSDQFSEDGVFPGARLLRPVSLSCAGHACVVADAATRTLRRLDFDAARLERVFGDEAAPLANIAAATMLDDDTVVYTNRSVLRIVHLGAATDDVFAQSPQFVGTPTAVASIGSGEVIFYDGAHVKEAPNNPRDLGVVSAPATSLAFDAARALAVSVSATAVDFKVLGGGVAPASFALGGAFGAGLAVAVDDNSNVYVATTVGVFEVFTDASTRQLATVGTPPLSPLFRASACAIEDGDLLVVDGVTGAVVRVAVR